jgi:hypothetical protein
MTTKFSRKSAHTQISGRKNPYVPLLHKMEHKLSKYIQALSKDLCKSKNYKVIEKDNNQILLLLGECNYIAKECERFEKQTKFQQKTQQKSKTKRSFFKNW